MCIEAGELHLKLSEEIFGLVKEASVSGEPVIRYMEYVFPGQGLAQINDQFMLGNTILVAPVTVQGAVSRTVVLPEGEWEYCSGEIFKGGRTVTVDAPLNVLPYFVKAK